MNRYGVVLVDQQTQEIAFFCRSAEQSVLMRSSRCVLGCQKILDQLLDVVVRARFIGVAAQDQAASQDQWHERDAFHQEATREKAIGFDPPLPQPRAP